MAKSDSYSIDALLRPDNHEDDKKIQEKNSTKAKALAKKLAGMYDFIDPFIRGNKTKIHGLA